jgi:tetratricopeptide (TPR) repeat protein
MRSVYRAAISVGTLTLTIYGIRASTAAEPPAEKAPATLPEGYVVAPFENASTVKSLDWMASALAVTTAEKLEGMGGIRPVYGASILEGWPAKLDGAKAAERARDAGARWLLTGSFSRPNWKAQVTVRVLEVVPGAEPSQVTLKETATASRTGERNALLAVLDEALDDVLAQMQRKAKEAKGWAPSGADAIAALKRRPTKDLYAFTLFGRALNLFYGINVAPSDQQAEKTLSRATSIDPKFAEARRMIGVVQLARGEVGRAAGQYAYALELKPGYYSAIVGLARLYRVENKKQPAREMAEKALGARPWDADMRLLLGTLEFEGGELDKALADLLKVVAVRPRDLSARRTLAQVYAARGDIEELAAELERIAELGPDDLEVRLDLAAAFMRLGRNEKAIAVYDEVLKRQPKHLQALKFTGDLYRRMGDPDKAIAAYERVKRLVPDDPRAYFLLGAAYAEAGNDTKATAVLEDAEGQFRAYLGQAWTDLGALALRRGDINRANAYLTRAVARSPMRPKTHFNYALLLEATRQPDKALAELRTAAELDPEDPECHYLAGVIHLRTGQFDEAKAEFAAALKLKPDHVDAKHNLALLEDLYRRYGSEHSGVGAQ